MPTLNEHDLERMATRLGQRAADEIDLDQVADRVTARLRSGERAPTPSPRWTWLAVAAAAVLVAVFGLQWLRFEPQAPPAVVAAPELDLLTEDELAEVLDSLDVQAPIIEFASVTLDDLNEQQLEELLATMEG